MEPISSTRPYIARNRFRYLRAEGLAARHRLGYTWDRSLPCSSYAHLGGRLMEPTYYRVNVSKATYLECWRAARTLFEFLLACVVKTLRLSFIANYAVTNEAFKRLEWNDLLEDVQRSLQPIRSEFETVGFRYCFCHFHPTLGTLRSATMTMLSPDNNSWVSVLCERHETGGYVNKIIATSIHSALSNGDILLTCDLQEPHPAEFVCERRAKYSPARLAARHNERIAGASPAYPISLPDEFAVERLVVEVGERVFQYGLDRGMLIPLTAAEVERYKAQCVSNSTSPPAPTTAGSQLALPPGDAEYFDLSEEHVFDAALAADSGGTPMSYDPVSRYPGVIAELEKIRNKKGSWLSGAVILAVSIVAFIGLGAARWDWKFALLLIPILLFHEMGHFVAMRMFKYRNLKMFFIPLLGAAVTGQNYNVAGWKKAIVSLAGPVPGIFVGSLLGIVALVLGDQELLLEAATLTVFLNAFNLLPFLPLDGGWIVHVLLFSRHHVLDTVFRSIAAAILILSGLLGLKFLMFIGIMMLMGLRSAYRVARVASEIRDAGIDTSSPDGQSIPIETADEIISRLAAAAPQPVHDAIRAQQTLQVFETVNARPPGVLGTLALTGIHAGSFVAALVFATILALAQHPDFAALFESGIGAPRYQYECGTAEQWPLAAERLPSGTASTVVATFSSTDKAEAAFAETKAELPEGAIVTKFGQSVLLTLDAKSPQVDAFITRFKSAFARVETAKPDEPLMITLDATLLTEALAESLENEATEYFSLPAEMAVFPPWDAGRELTESQKTARRTYQELVKFRPDENERFAELSTRIMESIQQKEPAKTQKILQEQQSLSRELQQEYNEQLLGREDLDKNVVEIYSRQPQMPVWTEFDVDAVDDDGEPAADHRKAVGNDERRAARDQWIADLRAWHLELGALMGQMPLVGDRPVPSLDGIVGSGGVERTELTLRFWIHFNQPGDGVLAVTNWLCGYDCSEVKYKFGYDE